MATSSGIAAGTCAIAFVALGPLACILAADTDGGMPAALRNAAVEHVTCQVCEFMVVEAAAYINSTKAKDSEDMVFDTVENLCMTSRKAGRWILTYDVSRVPAMPSAEMLDRLWERYSGGKEFLWKEDVHRLLTETDPRNPAEMLTEEQWRVEVCERRFRGADPEVGVSRQRFIDVYEAEGPGVVAEDYRAAFGDPGGQLRLFKQPDYGHCQRECQVLREACRRLHKRLEERLREGLLEGLPPEELQPSLCRKACGTRPQDLPELPSWENEPFKIDKLVVANDVMRLAQKKSRKMGYHASAIGGGSALNPDIDDDEDDEL